MEDIRSGELVGCTDVFWRPECAIITYRDATAVRPRGQGLGKWPKALMPDSLARNAPEARVIQTNNAGPSRTPPCQASTWRWASNRGWRAIMEWQLKLK